MKKFIKKFFLILFIVCATIFVLAYIFIQTQKPTYNGKVALSGFDSAVTVYFDEYAIPHIYASNARDAYRALGYVTAQDRIFQVELVRRVSAGRLSEILGSSLLETDKFFRMLGLNKQAERLSREFYSDTTEEWKKEMIAYVEGVNEYIERRSRRLEFKLLNIPSEKYTVKDVYLVLAYMAFNFEMGLRTDPLMTRIDRSFGSRYLADLGLSPGSFTGDSIYKDSVESFTDDIDDLFSSLPVPVWMGSNAIAVGSSRSASLKALLENDTHIGLQQPAVWYEAYLNYPGFDFYGSYLAGFPFAPTGHTDHHAWGVTILANDDFDLFEEKLSRQDTNTIVFKDSLEKMSLRTEIIKVKDSADYILNVRTTHHGPVGSDVLADLRKITSNPVSISWSFLQLHNDLPLATRKLAHAKTMTEFKEGVSEIGAPGLNVLYADCDDNIAWYCAGRFVERKQGINPNLFLDGSGNDEWLGFMNFERNPCSENPFNDLLFSSNYYPSPDSASVFPGYYLPADRWIRLSHLLNEKKQVSRKDLQKICLDVTNPIAAKVAAQMLKRLPGHAAVQSQIHERVYGFLSLWNGSHTLDENAPVIYYKWLYQTLKMAFEDELGEKDFTALLKTHVLKSSLLHIMENEASSWWDNIKTKRKETEADILSAAYDSTISQLVRQMGYDPDKWRWGNVHLIEFEHPLGKQKPLDKIYNIGPMKTRGGMETVNNQSFDLNESGVYKVNLSPAMRRTIDFADPQHAFNILPSGQSGNFTVKYYRNQSEMYVKGRFRKEIMDDKTFRSQCRSILVLNPLK